MDVFGQANPKEADNGIELGDDGFPTIFKQSAGSSTDDADTLDTCSTITCWYPPDDGAGPELAAITPNAKKRKLEAKSARKERAPTLIKDTEKL